MGIVVFWGIFWGGSRRGWGARGVMDPWVRGVHGLGVGMDGIYGVWGFGGGGCGGGA